MQRISLIAAAFVVASSGSAHAECLARKLTYGANEEVSASSPQTILVEVPAEEASTYTASGFAPASCTSDRQSARTKKMDVCAMAQFGNDAVQARFASLLGDSPAKLCASGLKPKDKHEDAPASK